MKVVKAVEYRRRGGDMCCGFSHSHFSSVVYVSVVLTWSLVQVKGEEPRSCRVS